MIALTIIIGIVALLLLITGIYRMVTSYEGGWITTIGALFAIIWFVLFICITNVRFSESTQTGYIYSKDSFAGVTTYHIRFSENAGEDTQPTFCTNTDSESDMLNAAKLDALVGSGEKVTINTPSVDLYFSNDLWHCAGNSIIKGNK